MASKTVPATKTIPASISDSPESSITTIKTATCKNLLATATISYVIGLDEASALWRQIAGNTGGGHRPGQLPGG
jgi:hypothetical protein